MINSKPPCWKKLPPLLTTILQSSSLLNKCLMGLWWWWCALITKLSLLKVQSSVQHPTFTQHPNCWTQLYAWWSHVKHNQFITSAVQRNPNKQTVEFWRVWDVLQLYHGAIPRIYHAWLYLHVCHKCHCLRWERLSHLPVQLYLGRPWLS